MKTPFSLFLALRYLKPKRAFLSIITLISILGVTLGITVLIVVIAVMTGFSQKFQQSVIGFEPHITVSSGGPMRGWRDIASNLEKQPGVVAVAPYIRGPVIAQTQSLVRTPTLQAIDPVKEEKIHDLKSFIKKGNFDLTGDNAVIGQAMADDLDVHVGDKITVYATNNIEAIIKELQREDDDPNAKGKTLRELKNDVVLPAELTITGIFESGRYEYDSGVILVPLNVGQELYELGGTVEGLSVRVTDPYLADKVEQELNDEHNRKLPLGVEAEAWMNGPHKSRIGAIKFEKNMMFIILMFLVVIAAFCVMNTLITVTVQKRREIGILKALGANVRQIVWVFLAQGMVVGFFGNVSGLALGMTIIRYLNTIKGWLETILHTKIFPQDIYEFSTIPTVITYQNVLVICTGSFIICSLAALIPAWFAARLDPVKALRYE